MLTRVIAPWLLPGGAVLALGAGVAAYGDTTLLFQLTGQYRWVVYGLAAALAGGFHRSRIFTAVLGLGALDLIAGGAPEVDALGAVGSVFIVAVGLLALARDRGVGSPTGVLQIGGTLALAAVPGLVFYDSVNVDAFIGVEFMPGWATEWSGYPQAIVLVAFLSLASAAYGYYRWRGIVERAFIWCQLTVLVAMHPDVGPPADAVLLMTAGVTLALAVLQTTYAMAYKDDLTGLPARRALMKDLEEMKGLYTAAMVDVDHFKKFNDKHGHDVGDQVLKLVASRLGRAGGGGRAYRYGGEEFTILFPGKVTDEAWGHLEDVRQAVEDATFALRSWNRPREKPASTTGAKAVKKLSVTVSVGLADSGPDDLPPEAVLKKADQALYRAKKAGRNRLAI